MPYRHWPLPIHPQAIGAVTIIDGPAEIEMIVIETTTVETPGAIEIATGITIGTIAISCVTMSGVTCAIVIDSIGSTGTGAVMMIGGTSDL